eukprot:TRINITY_DN9003_c0_g1_i1.p1 TRINITY_DN9003_c0_g1~~TRINITY_DN9003_c0_g1_i1.p1  ORF type:complete len:121 (-),score=1.32 TRINITY_DN9003_c0_g1_i1:225-587(-)
MTEMVFWNFILWVVEDSQLPATLSQSAYSCLCCFAGAGHSHNFARAGREGCTATLYSHVGFYQRLPEYIASSYRLALLPDECSKYSTPAAASKAASVNACAWSRAWIILTLILSPGFLKL